jgi:hypothetical protein
MLVSAIALDSPGQAYGIGGYIVGYTGTTFSIYCEPTGFVGSGTYTNWSFFIAGIPGQQGATGAQGITADQSLNTTSNVTFASVNVGGVVNIVENFTGISGTGQQTLDTWNAAFRSAKYYVQVQDGNDFHISEIVVANDGTNVHINQYGIVTSASSLGVFTAGYSSPNTTLLFTPAGASNMKIRVFKTRMAT